MYRPGRTGPIKGLLGAAGLAAAVRDIRMLNSTAILTASINLDLLFMGTFLLEDDCGE